MENSNGKRTFLYILLVVFVALGAFGFGVAATMIAGGNSPLNTAQVDNGGTASNNNSGSSSGSKQPEVPANLEEQFKPFWSTYRAIEDEYYYRPLDSQKMIYGATKGMIESLGDDF